MNQLLSRGQARAEEAIRRSVDTWAADGRITRRQADRLLSGLSSPEMEHALFHLSAHFAISLPLRFPLGASARFLYTLGLRLRAEVLGILRRRSPAEDRRTHTLPVMLFALLPGFGRLAYFLAPAMAGQKLMVLIPFDLAARRLPFALYARLHLDAIFVFWAEPDPGGGLVHSLQAIVSSLPARLGRVTLPVPLMAAVLLADAGALAAGAYIYLDSGRQQGWWFDERNVMATLDVAQLVVAALAGLAAYHYFWQRSVSSRAEAAGIFLWGIGGIGLLLFAADDYLTLHEHIGDFLQRSFGLGLAGTNTPDDFLIIAYAICGLSVLYVFRVELATPHASSALLLLAAAAAIVMVLSDAFGRSEAMLALEYPAQTAAAALLMFAFLSRYREVTAGRRIQSHPEPAGALAP